MADKTLTCRDCSNEFVFTSGEQEFYASKGFTREPTRCPECRTARKRDREGGYVGGTGGTYTSGNASGGQAPQQATATLNGVSAACIPSPVQTVARTRKCHSSLAVIAPSTAQTASGTIVPPPATRRLAKRHGIRPAKGPINRHRTQLSENRHGRFLANSCKRNLCFKNPWPCNGLAVTDGNHSNPSPTSPSPVGSSMSPPAVTATPTIDRSDDAPARKRPPRRRRKPTRSADSTGAQQTERRDNTANRTEARTARAGQVQAGPLERDRTFGSIAISEPIRLALNDMGYENPTPIQEQAIPNMLQGRDVVGRAQTGTGKTAAFGIPMIELLDPTRAEVQGIVLAQTRELAVQVTGELRRLAEYRGIKPLPYTAARRSRSSSEHCKTHHRSSSARRGAFRIT